MENETSETILINTTINEIYAITEITQSYYNDKSESIELKASFPIKTGVQLTKFTISIGTKTIVSKIEEKEKAAEKVNDAISSGNMGFYSQYSPIEKAQEVVIGNLCPKETVSMTSQYMQMISSNDMSYEVSLLQNYPCFLGNISDKEPLQIKGNAILKTKTKLTRLVINNENEEYSISKKYDHNYTQCDISYKYSKFPVNGEYPSISIIYRTENINKPTLYAQYDAIRKESSYVLNYIYSSNNIKEIPIPNKPDEDNLICYYQKYQNEIINDTPSLFIFLIDQSGSMKGEAIKLVKKSLKYFMQSLPPNSYFQLIGFGSSFKKYNESPVEYKESNIDKTLEIIDAINSNLGGTNLSSPLNEIYSSNQYNNINLSKNILILTDGEVNDKDKCIALCKEHSETFRIHAIGIGSSFDKELINKCGNEGKGSSCFVSDLNNVNSTVIECVNRCLRNYIMNSQFEVKDSMYKYPEKKEVIYPDDVIYFSYIRNGEISKDKVDFEFTALKPSDNSQIKEIISINSPEILEEGDTLSKIIIGNILREGKIENQVEISKKYQVLSSQTALYGEMKLDKDEKQGELIVVNLNENINFDSQMTPSRCKFDMDAVVCYDLCEDIIPDCKKHRRRLGKFRPKYKTGIKKKESNTISDYDDLIFAQNKIEGYWSQIDFTIDLFSKGKVKEIFEKVKIFIDKNVTNISDENKEKIIATFSILYFIISQNTDKKDESKLIINKAKKFLGKFKLNYDTILSNIEV